MVEGRQQMVLCETFYGRFISNEKFLIHQLHVVVPGPAFMVKLFAKGNAGLQR